LGSVLSPLTPWLSRRQHLLLAAGETGPPSTRRPDPVQAGADIRVRAPGFAASLRKSLLLRCAMSFAADEALLSSLVIDMYL